MKRYLSKCYTSIDTLPVFYWFKINETNNLSFLIYSSTVTLNKRPPKGLKLAALSLIWRDIYDEYIKEFGLGEDFIEIIRKEKRIIKLKLDKIVTDDRSLQTMININEIELAKMKSNIGKGVSYSQSKVYVEKGMGFNIDGLKTTVKEYYSYIGELQKLNKNG